MLAVPSLMKWGLSAAAGPAASTTAASAAASGPKSTNRSRRILFLPLSSPGLGDDFACGIELSIASPPFREQPRNRGQVRRHGRRRIALAARPADIGEQTRGGERAGDWFGDAVCIVGDAYIRVAHLREFRALLALRAGER